MTKHLQSKPAQITTAPAHVTAQLKMVEAVERDNPANKTSREAATKKASNANIA